MYINFVVLGEKSELNQIIASQYVYVFSNVLKIFLKYLEQMEVFPSDGGLLFGMQSVKGFVSISEENFNKLLDLLKEIQD